MVDPWRLAAVQAFLGHSTPTMTARYAHFAESELKRRASFPS
jgi:integrase